MKCYTVDCNGLREGLDVTGKGLVILGDPKSKQVRISIVDIKEGDITDDGKILDAQASTVHGSKTRIILLPIKEDTRPVLLRIITSHETVKTNGNWLATGRFEEIAGSIGANYRDSLIKLSNDQSVVIRFENGSYATIVNLKGSLYYAASCKKMDHCE